MTSILKFAPKTPTSLHVKCLLPIFSVDIIGLLQERQNLPVRTKLDFALSFIYPAVTYCGTVQQYSLGFQINKDLRRMFTFEFSENCLQLTSIICFRKFSNVNPRWGWWIKMSELTDLCGKARTICHIIFIKWEKALYKMGKSDAKCMD